ncbi:MAG TPA: hypothetical protein VF143_13035, partial [Candidatus Nanopelagicales bacterium]
MGELDEAWAPLRRGEPGLPSAGLLDGAAGADEPGFVEVVPGVRLAPEAPASLWRTVSPDVALAGGPAPRATAGAVTGGPVAGVRSVGRGTRGRLLVAFLALVLVAGVALAMASGWAASAPMGARAPSPVDASTPAGVPLPQGDGQASSASPPEASGGAPSTPGASPGPSSSPDWWAVLAQLDQCRGRALGAADPSLISSYAAPGSQVARADEALIAALTADGVTPRGWSTTLIALEEVVPEGETGPSGELDPAAGSQRPDGSEPSEGLEASADPGPSAALGPSAHPDLEPGADEDRDVMVGPAVRQVRLVVV